jgi:hypothetical protein
VLKLKNVGGSMLSNFGLMEIFILLIFFIAPFVLCIVALVDILRSTFEGINKIVWVLVVILLPLVGAILYFTIGQKQKSTLNDFYRNR